MERRGEACLARRDDRTARTGEGLPGPRNTDTFRLTEIRATRSRRPHAPGLPGSYVFLANGDNIAAMAQEPGRTLIDADTSIDGKIQGRDATIAGKFKGEVNLSGSLVLLPSASVDATVHADVVEVGGAFSGKITSKKLVVLETGKVTGTIDAGQLVVREGAVLNGPVAAGKSASGAATIPAGHPPAQAPAKS